MIFLLLLFQNNLHPSVNLDFKGKCRRSPGTSLKCSFHWGKADVSICRKPNGVPGQGEMFAPVRREVAADSLHWWAGFAFCNLLLQKVNPWHVLRRQTPTCCTCSCIQWKDFYGQGQERSGMPIKFMFLPESHAEEQVSEYEPLLTVKRTWTKEHETPGAGKRAGKYNVRVL